MTLPNRVRDVALALLSETVADMSARNYDQAAGAGVWALDFSIEMGIPAHILYGTMPSSVYTAYLARSYIKAAQAKLSNPRAFEDDED